MNKIIIISSGGHARSCADVIETEKKYKIIGFVDNNNKKSDYPVIGKDKDLIKLKKKCSNIFIGIGQIKSNLTRKILFNKCKKIGFKLPVIKSPNSYISKKSKIGEGTIIMHGAFIGPNSIIGKNCIINNYSHIEHDCIIGDNTHISTRVTINGAVKVGKDSFVGSGTIVRENVVIKKKSIITFGSLIRKNY
jgi:sugar O-acyltransferase (sialic acid O-acetyltransferase NeuD family)